MENIIVWLIMSGALLLIIREIIKTYKGEGGCCGSCGGCSGSGSELSGPDPKMPCHQGEIFLHKQEDNSRNLP